MKPILLVCLASALSLLSAQDAPQEERDWRLPFRSPGTDVAPPEQLFEHLTRMYAIARRAPAEKVSYDARGVEVIDDPAWQKDRDALDALPRIDAGHLSAIIRESRMAGDREIAFYGAFFVRETQYVMSLIEHIPGEPLRKIREAAWKRAVPFLEVHLPKINPGDYEEWKKIKVGPAGQKPPRPGDPSYALDVMPFVAMLALEDPRDNVQSLWFLAECARIREATGRDALGQAQPQLERLINHKEDMVREGAQHFVAAIDPEKRKKPGVGASQEVATAWLDSVLYSVFPPIRRLSEGLFELHASTDVEQIVKVGDDGLRNGTLGGPEMASVKNGGTVRGFKIGDLPSPLDKLGVPPGSVITTINGVPVATAQSLLGALERQKARRSFLVEFVDNSRRARAIEYRLVR